MAKSHWKNKGTGVDSFQRYIYIHGTPEEWRLGKHQRLYSYVKYGHYSFHYLGTAINITLA